MNQRKYFTYLYSNI